MLCHLARLRYTGVSAFQCKKLEWEAFRLHFVFIPPTPMAVTWRTCPKRFGLMFSSLLPEPHPHLFSGRHCNDMYYSGNPDGKHEKCIWGHVQTGLGWLLWSDIKRNSCHIYDEMDLDHFTSRCCKIDVCISYSQMALTAVQPKGTPRSSPLISPYIFIYLFIHFEEQQYIQGKDVSPWDQKSKVNTPLGMH